MLHHFVIAMLHHFTTVMLHHLVLLCDLNIINSIIIKNEVVVVVGLLDGIDLPS
jgi:hypothetical protein